MAPWTTLLKISGLVWRSGPLAAYHESLVMSLNDASLSMQSIGAQQHAW